MRDERRKASFEVDMGKVAAAKAVLGTVTLAETVDAALTEIIRIHERGRLADMLLTPDVLDLDDPEGTDDAWR